MSMRNISIRAASQVNGPTKDNRMSNPFDEAARELVGRISEIAVDKQAANAAAEAARLEKERSFERARILFRTIHKRVNECVRQANEAFSGTGLSLSAKVSPMQASNAGSITVSLGGISGQAPSFRIVGNASFKTFVHDLKDPSYGPFDLGDAEVLPYEEMIEQFIRTVTRGLEIGGGKQVP
jgi:hypothetical protein